MNILVLNGSPSGDNSITLQTVRFLSEIFTDHEYEVLNVGAKIRTYEKDFPAAEESLRKADLILFCYPVYTFLVPAQLHRFIELIKEHPIDLSGKYASQITTSKHFYDTTAHEFIRENCADLKLSYLRGLSADMEDLLHENGRREAVSFFKHLLCSIKENLSEPVFLPNFSGETFVASQCEAAEKTKQEKIVIVTDLDQSNEKLASMIERFRNVSPYETEVVNLREFPFSGGCLGCFKCASGGKCVYNDGFDTFLRENIQTAAATVYAFAIRDHSMGYRFKLYDDRQFCNGHRTVTMGKPVGYLIDGILSAEPNLLELIEARAQVGGNYLTRAASNEKDPDSEIDSLSKELAYAVENRYTQPASFYVVGGMKIFRDLIYLMQGLMREDHRFYKSHGFYDFPQKRRGRVAGMYLVGSMMQNKKLSKKIGANMTKGMLMPYQQVLNRLSKLKGSREETDKNTSNEE
ncbi:MAG: NAD(P)H-dependent oxidoreductase [Clostridia bacterium]|nr:NAD(P)H-dependent oxidoreductase [Clostridia bacterium]